MQLHVPRKPPGPQTGNHSLYLVKAHSSAERGQRIYLPSQRLALGFAFSERYNEEHECVKRWGPINAHTVHSGTSCHFSGFRTYQDVWLPTRFWVLWMLSD